MPITFPPGSPTLSGDILSISRFLNSPLLVLRALRDISKQMFIADKIFTGQLWTDSGSVIYEQNESIFADRVPKSVAPGAEYPLTPITTGPASTAVTVKWGQDALITDEAISRQRYPVVQRAFRKLINSHIQQIDSVALSAANSAVTQSTPAVNTWTGTGSAPVILRDLMRAMSSVINLKQGFTPDTVLLGLTTFANVVSDPTLMNLLPREYPGVAQGPLLAGWDNPYLRRIGGFTFITSPNLPTTGVATLLDSSVFGAFVDERLPEIGYVTGDNGVQVKTMREDDTDGWEIRCRRTTVPVVLEPNAAWKITGVDA